MPGKLESTLQKLQQQELDQALQGSDFKAAVNKHRAEQKSKAITSEARLERILARTEAKRAEDKARLAQRRKGIESQLKAQQSAAAKQGSGQEVVSEAMKGIEPTIDPNRAPGSGLNPNTVADALALTSGGAGVQQGGVGVNAQGGTNSVDIAGQQFTAPETILSGRATSGNEMMKMGPGNYRPAESNQVTVDAIPNVLRAGDILRSRQRQNEFGREMAQRDKFYTGKLSESFTEHFGPQLGFAAANAFMRGGPSAVVDIIGDNPSAVHQYQKALAATSRAAQAREYAYMRRANVQTEALQYEMLRQAQTAEWSLRLGLPPQAAEYGMTDQQLNSTLYDIVDNKTGTFRPGTGAQQTNVANAYLQRGYLLSSTPESGWSVFKEPGEVNAKKISNVLGYMYTYDLAPQGSEEQAAAKQALLDTGLYVPKDGTLAVNKDAPTALRSGADAVLGIHKNNLVVTERTGGNPNEGRRDREMELAVPEAPAPPGPPLSARERARKVGGGLGGVAGAAGTMAAGVPRKVAKAADTGVEVVAGLAEGVASGATGRDIRIQGPPWLGGGSMERLWDNMVDLYAAGGNTPRAVLARKRFVKQAKDNGVPLAQIQSALQALNSAMHPGARPPFGSQEISEIQQSLPQQVPGAANPAAYLQQLIEGGPVDRRTPGKRGATRRNP